MEIKMARRGSPGVFIATGSDVFTIYELRHTAAAFMIDVGADPLWVMRRMGHSDIRTTYNLYGPALLGP